MESFDEDENLEKPEYMALERSFVSSDPVKLKPSDSYHAHSTSALRQRIVRVYSPEFPQSSSSDVYTDTSPTTSGETNFENEPPLLEELGIDLNHIILNATLILNPLREPDTNILKNNDLTGPFVFSFAFGGFLLLCGKFHFGYVYCFGVMGCAAMYVLLNLMSLIGISFSCTASVLGYCQLPLVIFSALAVLFPLKGTVGTPFAVIAVLWCATPASKLFLSELKMQDDQQPLLLYPCSLVYGMFALLILY